MARETKKLTANVPELDEPSNVHSQVKRPPLGRFQLQVDRQTKRSFSTSEAAEEAGRLIKRGHPIVQVAIYDSVECQNKLIELPEPEASAG
jgi:hypothetical protein